MPTKEVEYKIRDFLGVDLTDNARVAAPGTWRKLQNLYAPSVGRLEQRPGASVFAHIVVAGVEIRTKDEIEEPADDFEPAPIGDYGGFPEDTTPGSWDQLEIPDTVVPGPFLPSPIFTNFQARYRTHPIFHKLESVKTKFGKPAVGDVIFKGSF